MRLSVKLTAGAVALLAVVAGGTAYGLTSRPHTPKPPVSVSCQQAANAQNAYARLADRQGYLTTFTNEQIIAANDIDSELVAGMVKAGCSQTVRFFDMLTGEWDN